VRRPASFALPLLLVATSPASAADPPDAPLRAEPPVAIAVVAGIATALVPLIIGGMYIAAHQDDGPRDVGVAVSGVGAALSPIVAHAILGEWKRAAVFGALPVASEIGLSVFLATAPDSAFHGTQGTRTAFGLLYTADLFGAALSMVDVMMARDRARSGAIRSAGGPLRVVVSPAVGRGQAGIVLGGSL
jgi:hypothetical protein